MERQERRTKRGRKSPRVPIKTYKWEEVRRARKKGGYPWTHLYKQPFDEELDPSAYTMEGLRKAKSTSTVGDKSYFTISEMTESERGGSVTPDIEKIDTTLQIITEPDDHSAKHSATSVLIEECEVSDRESKRPEFTIDSAESSDDVSQYLDKEYRSPENEQTSPKSDEKMQNDEIDEDTSKRKRKLSADSSYSKISQTKSALLQKLKDTKNKIKIPKFSLPVSKIKKPAPAKKLRHSPPETKKERKKSNGQPKETKPIYIHIPLKPAPGETDEFSHFELEGTSEDRTKIMPAGRKPGSFKDLVRNLKQLKETKEIKEDPLEEQLDLREDMGSAEDITEEQLDLTEQQVIEEPKYMASTNGIAPEENKVEDSLRIDIDEIEAENMTNKELIADENEKPMEIEHSSNKPVPEIAGTDNILKSKESVEEDTGLELKRQSNEKMEIEELEVEDRIESDDETQEPKEDVFEHLFRASSSKSKEEATVSEERPVRSKSAEPEKRRKLSLESSYSRKSLSKLGFMKKLKNASEKLKSTFNRSSSKNINKPKIVAELKKEPKPAKPLKPLKFPEPVYIHIPLKPPEGEQDKFSYLEKEQKEPTTAPEKVEIETPSTPDSTLQSNDVQLIILTAPSDDEVLDYHSSDVPETPSSESGFFDKIDELKQLAKGAVEVVTTPHKLDPVKEESPSDKISIEETSNGKITPEKAESVVDIPNEKVVDIEDGLSESKTSKTIESTETKAEMAETADHDNKEIKSVLKGGGSPVIKKKVSFKRRSKTPKDGSYEDIQAPDLGATVSDAPMETKLVPEIVSSTTIDNVMSHLEEKFSKTTSLEEDYKKWSKTSDHEYEPVNPPPDNFIIATHPPPVATIEPVYELDNQPDADILPIGDVPEDATPAMRFRIDETQEQADENTGRVSPNVTFASELEQATTPTEKPKSASNRFQMAFKQKTDNFKTKLHNIKRPNIHLPERPKFTKPNLQKFKIEKPKFNLPKLPDRTKITMPSFSLPRKNTTKQPHKERQLSTESNAGDASDSKKPMFDFSTYPRLFKKKEKPKKSSTESIPSFATVPRSKKTNSSTAQDSSKWSGSESIRIPLHSEESMEAEYLNEVPELPSMENNDHESIEHIEPSHIRYDQDIDIDDEYERENQALNRDFTHRWDRGRFNPDQHDDRMEHNLKITDLDSPEEPPGGYEFVATNNNNSKDIRDNYSSGSSHGPQAHSGVLEEINSDEFLWRQKGISEENMDIRLYLSSEIKEAFRTPTNALTKMDDNHHDRHYDLRGSNQSLPETPTKKKSIKKPKRKKTPHASQERIAYTGESADEDDLDAEPPSRPRRRSKRTRKPKHFDDIIPYQETISVDIGQPNGDTFRHRESLGGILGDDEGEDDSIMYENELMEGKEQPEILVTDPYREMEFRDKDVINEKPAAPPRKHKSLKSLTVSENDSILDDIASRLETEIEVIKTDSKVIIPIQDEPPKRPSRSTSRTGSRSRGASQQDISSLSRQVDYMEPENQVPCTEEPCIRDIRGSMGYAIIDKSKVREPPLPPPRTLRRKRSLKISDEKFFTVPRRRNEEEVPMRPLRNYSTLTQVKKSIEQNTYENKENIDITGYVEIDDEPNKDLQSGEIIQKMKDRPLPAPPRPPRKSRTDMRHLQDITSRENIISDVEGELEKHFDETETATQTEPLPDDFVCEEVIQEPTDTIIIASKTTEEKPVIEKRLITPTNYSYEETITHASLIVEPLDGAQILPDSDLSGHELNEYIIPVSRESDIDETSSIPEDFHKLKDATNKKEFESNRVNYETEVMKTQKLQVTDLDVDTLTVHKLLADKILVSEIDSSSVSTNEISSKTGSLKVGEITLPPGVIEGIIRTIQSSIPSYIEQTPKGNELEDDGNSEQKKTPIIENHKEEIACAKVMNSDMHYPVYETSLETSINPVPASGVEQCEADVAVLEDPLHQTNIRQSESPEKNSESEPPEIKNQTEPPPRPPRHSEKSKSSSPPYQENNSAGDLRQEESKTSHIYREERMLEPEVDDEPPPRPPQPQLPYIPSQPPASFYALRAQKYVESLDVDNNIPVIPRRRRHARSRPRTRSSSEDSSGATPASRRLQRRRSSDPPLSQLTIQLARACGTEVNNSLKRLMTYILNNVLGNQDGKQDLNVMIIIVLVLLTGLILLGYGDEKTVVHLHHWEYFNPPRDS